MKEREHYEGLFRRVLIEGRQCNAFEFGNASFASKAVLAILNNPVLWYRRREGEEKAARETIVEAFTGYALACVKARQKDGQTRAMSGGNQA